MTNKLATTASTADPLGPKDFNLSAKLSTYFYSKKFRQILSIINNSARELRPVGRNVHWFRLHVNCSITFDANRKTDAVNGFSYEFSSKFHLFELLVQLNPPPKIWKPPHWPSSSSSGINFQWHHFEINQIRLNCWIHRSRNQPICWSLQEITGFSDKMQMMTQPIKKIHYEVHKMNLTDRLFGWTVRSTSFRGPGWENHQELHQEHGLFLRKFAFLGA